MEAYYRARDLYRHDLALRLRSVASNWVRIYAGEGRYDWAFGEGLVGYKVTVTQEISGEMQDFEGRVVGFDEMTNSYQVEFEIQVQTLVFNQYADFTPLEIQKMGFKAAEVYSDEAAMMMEIFGCEDEDSPIPF